MGYYLQADLYDQVYADVVADIAPHVQAARDSGGRVLEVCCGTGRLLVPTVAAGVVCDGLDQEPAMLERARVKLAASGLSAELVAADMRDFTRPMRYALIAIGFNSFLHNLTQADQLATLKCCREHLETDGALQIVAFHPSVAQLLKWCEAERLSTDLPIEGTRDRLRVYDRAEDDRIEQIRHMTRRIERVDAAGTVREERVLTFALRYVYKPEMELLLRVAGFARWTMEPLFERYQDSAAAGRGGAPAREGDVLRWTAWRT